MKRREFFTVQSRETLENALEPHADLRAAPQSIYRGKRRIDIIEIIDQWYGPGYRYVKVRGHDRSVYILRFDEIRNGS